MPPRWSPLSDCWVSLPQASIAVPARSRAAFFGGLPRPKRDEGGLPNSGVQGFRVGRATCVDHRLDSAADGPDERTDQGASGDLVKFVGVGGYEVAGDFALRVELQLQGTGGAGDAWFAAANSLSESLGVPIAVQPIGLNTGICDIDGKWAASTGLSSDGVLLVRPDDFVAWRAETLPAAPEQQFRRVLSQIPATGQSANLQAR